MSKELTILLNDLSSRIDALEKSVQDLKKDQHPPVNLVPFIENEVGLQIRQLIRGQTK